jgi:hypothetical protein
MRDGIGQEEIEEAQRTAVGVEPGHQVAVPTTSARP